MKNMRTVYEHTETRPRREGARLRLETSEDGVAIRITCDVAGERAVSHLLLRGDFDALVAAARTFPGTDGA